MKRGQQGPFSAMVQRLERERRRGIIETVLYAVVYVFVGLLWAVIGFVICVPFLTRMILIFTAAVVKSVYSESNMHNAERGLDAAVTLYIRGFQKIRASWRGESGTPRLFDGPEEKRFWAVLSEFVFAMISRGSAQMRFCGVVVCACRRSAGLISMRFMDCGDLRIIGSGE